MAKQPELKTQKTLWQNGLTFAGSIGWLGVFVYILFIFPDLPDRVPIHFNINGMVDSWGYKGFIWVLPVIGIAVWGALTIMEKAPQHFDYLVTITEENAARQYKNAVMLISVLKTEIMAYFVFTTWQINNIAIGKMSAKSVWDVPLFLTVIFGTLGIFMYRMLKLK
ncbi:DUF1648 domain-containing protein [Rossellomorea oryzaecorticis]|uniref:DUF1648 domain-containing protein n=1 Tax=Rossellomorea oryzaecorticis TaxID=1396505 RepID=A0ABU9K5P9_9BACI